MSSRQKLDGQKQENLTVQAVRPFLLMWTHVHCGSSSLRTSTDSQQQEFKNLKDEDVIYKMVGPVLLKQEKFEAENTVTGRLDFISGEM